MFHKRKISWTNWGETLPTDEDLFDINLSSIVSDVRHILMGNLTPRSYAEFAPVWQEEEYLGRVPRYKRPTGKTLVNIRELSLLMLRKVGSPVRKTPI
jgi:hypothetical protein